MQKIKDLLSLFAIAGQVYGFRFLIFGIIAGCSNILLITIINETIRHGIKGSNISMLLLFGYIGAMLIYFVLQYFYQALLIKLCETLIFKNRIELIQKIRASSLKSFEEIGGNKFFVLLAHDTNTLGQILTVASSSIMSFIVITGSLCYLAILSFKGFLIALFILISSLGIAFSRQKINLNRIKESIIIENLFLEHLRSLMLGMKEVKMDSFINNGIYNTHIKPTLEELTRVKIRNGVFQSRFSLLGQFIFFLTMGCILFVFPLINVSITQNPEQFVIVLLYILFPIQTLIPLIPQYSHIAAIADRIKTFQSLLKEEKTSEDSQLLNMTPFQQLSIQELLFKYQTNNNEFEFNLGPINLDIKAGDVIFIHGDNGSGKSTFIKVLCGLYPRTTGKIVYNDLEINELNIQKYRNMFGVVFTDNHLFEYLYDDNLEEKEIKKLIAKFGLAEKITVDQNKFNTIDLSEGQKKRIALLGMLARDKPIYIFDEWAANQDPDFRHFFYTVLIPELSAQNKVIFVITHDERYLSIARRILRMENGNLQEQFLPKEKISSCI